VAAQSQEVGISDHRRPFGVGDRHCGGAAGARTAVRGRAFWIAHNVTANNVRDRIELILDAARVRGLRPAMELNPARWRGHLEHVLPKPAKVHRPKHMWSLHYDLLPAFMSDLEYEESNVARALEFTILTAARTNEVLGAHWSEIDFKERSWTVPEGRMKGGRKHKVALSDAAMAILEVMRPQLRGNDGFIFPSEREPRKGLSHRAMAKLCARMKCGGTVHGFRGTFKTFPYREDQPLVGGCRSVSGAQGR
jgi:integrase